MSEPVFLYSWKSKKNIINLSSAKLAQSALYVKSAFCRYREVLVLTISITKQYHHTNKIMLY